jgi:hypothetical protein
MANNLDVGLNVTADMGLVALELTAHRTEVVDEGGAWLKKRSAEVLEKTRSNSLWGGRGNRNHQGSALMGWSA